jgi:hypothetical protein
MKQAVSKLAAIIYRQITEIDRVLLTWDSREEDLNPALLTHINPIGWDNILLYREYWLDRTRVCRPHVGPTAGLLALCQDVSTRLVNADRREVLRRTDLRAPRAERDHLRAGALGR